VIQTHVEIKCSRPGLHNIKSNKYGLIPHLSLEHQDALVLSLFAFGSANFLVQALGHIDNLFFFVYAVFFLAKALVVIQSCL